MTTYRQTAVFSELKRRVAQIENRKNSDNDAGSPDTGDGTN